MGSVGIIIALAYLVYAAVCLIIVRRARPNARWHQNVILASVGWLILVFVISRSNEAAIFWVINAIGFWFGVLAPAVVTAVVTLGPLIKKMKSSASSES